MQEYSKPHSAKYIDNSLDKTALMMKILPMGYCQANQAAFMTENWKTTSG